MIECPHCKRAKNSVIDSRPAGFGIRRRRECFYCRQRFTTYEIEEALFNRDKHQAINAVETLESLRQKLNDWAENRTNNREKNSPTTKEQS